MNDMQKQSLAIAAVGTLGIAMAVIALTGRSDPWGTWAEATCMPDACFCEAVRDSFVRQPFNALSGLAFFAVGLAILVDTFGNRQRRPDNLMERHRLFPILFAASTIVIGLGTTFYHMSLTFIGQTVDVLGMYLLVTFIILYGLVRRIPVVPWKAGVGYVVGNVLLLSILVMAPEARRYAFALLVLVAIALESDVRRRATEIADLRYFAGAVAVLAIGFAFWIVDIRNIYCVPSSWLQGHAIWHVSGAAATALMFFYFVTARLGTPSVLTGGKTQ